MLRVSTIKELANGQERKALPASLSLCLSVSLSLSLSLPPSIVFSTSLAKLKASESYGDSSFNIWEFLSFSNLLSMTFQQSDT